MKQKKGEVYYPVKFRITPIKWSIFIRETPFMYRVHPLIRGTEYLSLGSMIIMN